MILSLPWVMDKEDLNKACDEIYQELTENNIKNDDAEIISGAWKEFNETQQGYAGYHDIKIRTHCGECAVQIAIALELSPAEVRIES